MAKYYWLKLKNDFFSDLNVKKLRRQQNGDSFLVIYLKMLLKAIANDGYLDFDGTDDLITDLSVMMDEDDFLIRSALDAMLRYGLAAAENENRLYLPAVAEYTGSETAWAEKKRAYRKKLKEDREGTAEDIVR